MNRSPAPRTLDIDDAHSKGTPVADGSKFLVKYCPECDRSWQFERNHHTNKLEPFYYSGFTKCLQRVICSECE